MVRLLGHFSVDLDLGEVHPPHFGASRPFLQLE